MFHMADNEEIGQYLKENIYARFKSNREFCRKWLEAEHMDINDLELRRKSNKLTQIQKGRKSVQIEDLPVFSGLLDLTCEQILSAGKVWAEDTGRLTNYHVAFTHDPELWETYVQREDRIFLCADEYNKTVIDYALEFKNYEFLKYLMDKGHIKFVVSDHFGYFRTFGAHTDIERRPVGEDQNLESIIRNDDSFRRRVISLAIENQDPQVLSELKAREIPALYHCDHYVHLLPDCKEYRDEPMLRLIAALDPGTLAYFYESFEVPAPAKKTYTFLFPFVAELTDLLIQNGHSYTGTALKKCYEHNKYVRSRLEKLEAEDHPAERFEWISTEERERHRFEELFVSEEGNMVSYLSFFQREGFLTNLIYIDTETEDLQLNRLIRKINDIYNWVAERATLCERR